MTGIISDGKNIVRGDRFQLIQKIQHPAGYTPNMHGENQPTTGELIGYLQGGVTLEEGYWVIILDRGMIPDFAERY